MANCLDCDKVLVLYTAKRCKSCAAKGKLNHEWKGGKVGYVALHEWIYKRLGKANKCENPNCIYPRSWTNRPSHVMLKPKRFEWANKNHKYLRKLSDWISLCVSCHKLYDRKKLFL